MTFIHNASALHRAHHAPALVQKALDGRPSMASATAQPKQWPFGGLKPIGQGCQTRMIQRREGHGLRESDRIGHLDLHGLHIDGDFNADRPARCGGGKLPSLLQSRHGVFRGIDSKGRLTHRSHHVQLCGMLVNESQLAIQEFRLNLASEVQQRRARRVGLDHGASGIATPGARAGDADPDDARNARRGIGHVACPRFTP